MLFPNQSEIGLLLLSVEMVILLLPFFIPALLPLLKPYFWLWILLFCISLGLIEWKVLLGIVLFIACLTLFGVGLNLRERLYAKNYPVFASTPKMLARTVGGPDYLLYIAEIELGFIIGIAYEEQVDGSAHPVKTRWKEVFPSYEIAEQEVIKRCQKLAAEYGTPNPSIETMPDGAPLTKS